MTRFEDFMTELEREARSGGTAAVAELKYLKARYGLARRFAEARRKRGWTQRELARKTGIRQSEISLLERGQANSTYKTLQTLAAALGGKIDLVMR
jgi:ribosome-binding protein aMBF1 (putative translation factor)